MNFSMADLEDPQRCKMQNKSKMQNVSKSHHMSQLHVMLHTIQQSIWREKRQATELCCTSLDGTLHGFYQLKGRSQGVPGAHDPLPPPPLLSPVLNNQPTTGGKNDMKIW